MLKDKGEVRLRSVLSNGSVEGGSEQLVPVETLAWTIRDLSPTAGTSSDDLGRRPLDSKVGASGPDNVKHETSSGSSSREPSIECIYVQNDQFFDCERPVSKADSRAKSKTITKTMRGITQRAEAFLRSMVDPGDGPSSDLPVFVVTDASFWCLRDFGTHLMKSVDGQAGGGGGDDYPRNQCSSARACLETTESYPGQKRSLKTLGAAIDNYMKRNGFWNGGGQAGEKNHGHNHGNHHHHNSDHRQEVIFLLYSKPDDRFDMVALQC